MLLRKAFVLSLLALFVSTCKKQKKELNTDEISFKKEGTLEIHRIARDSETIRLDIEIAISDYEIETGLMYRNGMKTNQAMLFIFPNLAHRHFYMRNTRFSLDIIYIDDKKRVVSFQKNATAFEETSLPSIYPAQYVLEVNAGLVDQWGLKVGDSISFSELSAYPN